MDDRMMYIQIITMMSGIGKKKIRQLQVKKPVVLTRLIKCYVCNQHFDSQINFQTHLREHQNKLNRTNIQEIQRKTQESFRSKKHPSSLNKTQKISHSAQEKNQREDTKDCSVKIKEDISEDQYERQIEDALKQSQILLQKIEFITQIGQDHEEQLQAKQQEEEIQEIQKNINNQKQLYNIVMQSNDQKINIQPLVLATNFENKRFQNYQEQLIHLRALARAAINSASVATIIAIRKNICCDIFAQLEQLFKQLVQIPAKSRKQIKVQAALTESNGQLKYCGECFSPIEGSSQYFSLSCGHSFHKDCWDGECCGE